MGKDVTITNGVTIGNGVVAGAGAVITMDVPDYAVVDGVLHESLSTDTNRSIE